MSLQKADNLMDLCSGRFGFGYLLRANPSTELEEQGTSLGSR